MRARLVTLSLCLSVLLVLPSQANEKPTPEYQKAMKELGTVNNHLRNSLKDIDFAAIEKRSLHGGYAQVSYRQQNGAGTWVPFGRWHYFDGGRKFGTNAPRSLVNEMDIGLEFARWAEVELTVMYTRTFERTRGNLFPYESTRDANRVGFQVQWNY